MNDTPETDDEWNRFAGTTAERFARKLYEHAKKMELERNEARKLAEWMREMIDQFSECDDTSFPWDND